MSDPDNPLPIYGALPDHWPKWGSVTARLEHGLFVSVQQMAKEQHRSVSGLVKHLLLQELERRGLHE